MEVGFWAIVPPLLTIVLAIITKEVLLSLFIGVYTGCLIIVGWNPLAGMEKMVEIIIAKLTDPWNMQVLIIVVLLGGLIGLLTRSGGSTAFGDLLGRKIKTKKGAQGTTWLIGLIIFFDDYFNALTNGAIMRPISDKFGVSREKLSYIIDSTAVGICLVVPLSSWVAFICSLIADSYATAGVEEDSFHAFLMCIPFNYYAWLSIIMVIVVVYLGLDFGPMAKAEKRTMETGALCDKTFSGGGADDDDFSSIEQKNGGAIDLLAPILLLIICALTFMLYTGGFFESFSVLDAVNNMDGMLALTYAVSISVIFSIIFYSVRRLSKVSESIAAFVIGTKSMLFVVILLAFAWGIGGVGDELDTAGYVASLFIGNVPPFLIALIIFAFSCVMTFSTGATWGTYAIMIPLAVPLALAMDISVYACVAAVIGGGGFGNHCSPLADTAILSSAAANIRHTDHIKTQIPYSVTCALVACVGFLISGFMDNWVIPMVVVLALFLASVFTLNKIFGANRYQIDREQQDENIA
ncbi:Na+/H+ antiporter NhaC family protein [Sinanaerobacter chloroacetimidivorans]|uniref:Na+/H+ antiporter NhaC family protein n=1 Tax=Sinanaerobacter chloroacetimidivorans TaxID=2818044 RepID=A0A8J8B2P3_9FIRM|nr:Na+/H+ antiporter NhaC family protein [Sinanaerobacter chloroacetimidivorans]MBR0598946.1 Na+/H+ antiporter NhaC family protein [Sinanaerobacter chloroacetimidivorans]